MKSRFGSFWGKSSSHCFSFRLAVIFTLDTVQYGSMSRQLLAGYCRFPGWGGGGGEEPSLLACLLISPGGACYMLEFTIFTIIALTSICKISTNLHLRFTPTRIAATHSLGIEPRIYALTTKKFWHFFQQSRSGAIISQTNSCMSTRTICVRWIQSIRVPVNIQLSCQHWGKFSGVAYISTSESHATITLGLEMF